MTFPRYKDKYTSLVGVQLVPLLYNEGTYVIRSDLSGRLHAP
jgi:hypothetical protein